MVFIERDHFQYVEVAYREIHQEFPSAHFLPVEHAYLMTELNTSTAKQYAEGAVLTETPDEALQIKLRWG